MHPSIRLMKSWCLLDSPVWSTMSPHVVARRRASRRPSAVAEQDQLYASFNVGQKLLLLFRQQFRIDERDDRDCLTGPATGHRGLSPLGRRRPTEISDVP